MPVTYSLSLCLGLGLLDANGAVTNFFSGKDVDAGSSVL